MSPNQARSLPLGLSLDRLSQEDRAVLGQAGGPCSALEAPRQEPALESSGP